MEDLEAEMGHTLDEFIASLPKEEQNQIETRYRELANNIARRQHLRGDGDQKSHPVNAR
jgi:hypothetical protein